ncbi:uncharacterized protein [Procambarus clarkii]|uniref:uncharacterized protein n=1 Tax=Procambarus clarkii TaxID=6728 RepID=UPI00374238E9
MDHTLRGSRKRMRNAGNRNAGTIDDASITLSERTAHKLQSTSIESSELDEVIDELAQYEEDIRVKLLPYKKNIAKNKLTVTSTVRTDPEVKLPQINIPTFSGDENESWDDFWKSLQNFRLELESLLKALSLKVQIQSAEWMTKVVVKRKLPRETLDKLCTIYNTTFLTLKEITEGLHTLVERQRANQDGEKVTNSSTNSHRNSTQVDTSVKPKQTLNKSNKFTSKTTLSTGKRSGNVGTYSVSPSEITNDLSTKENKSNKERRCLLCNQGHTAYQCSVYPTYNARIKRLQEIRKCTRCMGSHDPKKCVVPLRPCNRCNQGVHHYAL